MARVFWRPLQRGQGGGVFAGAAAPLHDAVRRVEVTLVALVEGAGDRLGLLLGHLVEVGGGVHAVAQGGELGGEGDHLAPTVAGVLVPRQRPSPADVSLAGSGRGGRQRLVDSLGPDQERGHVRGRGCGQGDQPAAGPDRLQDVLDRRRAEHPDRPVGGLLDRLEQGVAGLVGEPVGVLDHEHLPPPPHRGECRPPHQVAHLVDTDRELLGADHRHVGVGPGQHRVAGVALPAAGPLALQGGGEGDRGVGATGPGWSGEQPGVGHPVAAGRRLQRGGSAGLADQVVPDASRCSGLADGSHFFACASSGSTRRRTSAAMSSTGRRASTTR